MLAIAIVTSVRYGIDLRFDPEHNEHIGAFIASIAGTLFSLANAALLFSALQAQRKANELTESNHALDLKERNYDRLSGRVQELENRILNYKVIVVDSIENGKSIKSERTGYEAWEQAFQFWVNVSLPSSVWAGLRLEHAIDPEAYLHDQTFMLDTLVHLNYLIEDIRRSSLDRRDLDFLLRRAERLRNRLATHKDRIRTARDFLRETVEKGIAGVPKRDYVSPLLHVIRQMDEALGLLPDVPYRTLSPFQGLTIQMSGSSPSVILASTEVPTVQIDRVQFKTTDRSWTNRLIGKSVKVEMEAIDESGKQLYYESRLLSIGVLFFEHGSQYPDFDTKGGWAMEGRYNEWAGPPESHKRWRIQVSVPDLDYRPEELIALTLYTNALTTPDQQFGGFHA